MQQPILIYHRIPREMKGLVLYPLNQLKDRYSDVYTKEVSKYHDRKWVMDIEIPELGCKWNDVLHFSVVKPELIESALKEIGFDYEPDSYLTLQITDLPKDQWLITHDPIEGDEVRTKDLRYLSSHTELPAKVKSYYKECFEKEIHPLLYHGLPHVLFKGTVKLPED